MKPTASTKISEKKAPSTITTQKSGNVPVTTSFAGDVFSRLLKMKKEKGFLQEQEIVRLAVVSFLERNGY